jgi:GAF domain/Stage II sporulation protein E (SpoIIE)
MAPATRFMKVRVVAVATRCKIARSRPVPTAPSGGRYVPASLSKVACSPAGVSVMSASRAGNSPPPGPVGRGFAGRIAAGCQPVILDRVDHTTVLNPILWTKGIQSMMGVPMVAEGTVIGVLHVGSLTRRRFTRDDVELLQLAADRAAAAVRSATAAADRVAAAALQRSLIPTALPAVAGTDMAARYVPGSGAVGGDWYDVFTLPSGELCVAVGDVARSGLVAAVIMGRMRSSLRSYALETTDPAEVLGRLTARCSTSNPTPWLPCCTPSSPRGWTGYTSPRPGTSRR